MALGFPQGTLPQALIKRSEYQNEYHKAHKAAHKKASGKYDKKARSAFPSLSTKQSKYLFAAINKERKLKERKLKADAAYKTMLQLQKLWPRIHNRKYHLSYLNSINRDLSKLQRSDDLSKLQKTKRNTKGRSQCSKSTSRL